MVFGRLCMAMLVAAGLCGLRGTAQTAPWRQVREINRSQLPFAALSARQRVSLRNLLHRRASRDVPDCVEDYLPDDWEAQVSVRRIPLGTGLTYLVQLDSSCALNGLHGTMWLVSGTGSKLRLLAGPQERFGGNLDGVEPATLSWTARRGHRLAYFRFRDGHGVVSLQRTPVQKSWKRNAVYAG